MEEVVIEDVGKVKFKLFCVAVGFRTVETFPNLARDLSLMNRSNKRINYFHD